MEFDLPGEPRPSDPDPLGSRAADIYFRVTMLSRKGAKNRIGVVEAIKRVAKEFNKSVETARADYYSVRKGVAQKERALVEAYARAAERKARVPVRRDSKKPRNL